MKIISLMSDSANRQKQRNSPNDLLLYVILSAVGAFWAVYYFNATPAFTDAYYHLNGATSLASGAGFTDPYLWVYISAPDSLPAPSHLYWMPGTSVIAAFGMVFFGTTYAAAQIGLALCLWGALLLAYWLGWHLGKTARHAWIAGILTLFSGFFLDTWGQTDTFAPYAFFGAGALVCMALGISEEKDNGRYWLLAGIFAGIGHLIRNDGMLLVLTGWSVLLWVFNGERYRERIGWLVIFTLAYLVTMSPWFMRNLDQIGRILPTGGTQNAWFTSYDELFSYPPDASPETLFAEGNAAFFEARRFALLTNNGIPLQALVYQGAIIFFPFILIGLWQRRKDPFIRPFWIFAVGLHLAFALVFPYAGVRGGFWHGVAALVPIWAVIGILGLDDFVRYVSGMRRTWNPKLAQPFLSAGFVAMTLIFSVYVSNRNVYPNNRVPNALAEIIPADATVMSVDPAKIYYFTGITGVVIPNETPAIALDIANLYDIDYVLLEEGFIATPMQFTNPPDFLIPIEFDVEGARLYAFDRD